MSNYELPQGNNYTAREDFNVLAAGVLGFCVPGMVGAAHSLTDYLSNCDDPTSLGAAASMGTGFAIATLVFSMVNLPALCATDMIEVGRNCRDKLRDKRLSKGLTNLI